jgi:hypothetical protein
LFRLKSIKLNDVEAKKGKRRMKSLHEAGNDWLYFPLSEEEFLLESNFDLLIDHLKYLAFVIFFMRKY